MKYKDRGILRTSPPSFEDQPQLSQQDQSSKGLLDTPNSSPDEASTVRRKARSPKSPARYIPDKFPPLHFPDPATRKASRRKPRVYTAEEDEQLLQSALRKQEANNLERQRLYGIPLERGKALPAKASPSISQRDQCVQAPYNTPNQDKAFKPKEHQQVKQSPTDEYPKKLRPKWNSSPPLLAHGRTDPDDQSETVFRGPSVRLKIRSPKSPPHYTPDRLPPLKIADFSKEPPARRALRMKKKPMGKDDEQILQADDPSWLKVMRVVEVMRLERLRRQAHQQLKQSLYQKIKAMNLRRSHRQGITIRQSDNASSASSHSVSLVYSVVEELSIAEIFPVSKELRQLKPTLLEKIEAMRLKRSRRHGTAIYRSKASVPIGLDPAFQLVEVEEVSSKTEPQHRSSEASPQQLEPSLWNKVEAIKQRLSRQQGTAIYQAQEARDQSLASLSLVDQAPGVLLGTQVHKQKFMLEKPPNFRVHSCQDFEAVKLGNSRRQGMAQSV